MIDSTKLGLDNESHFSKGNLVQGSSKRFPPSFHKLAAEKMSANLIEFVGKVDLVITSPPYHNAISYESHAIDPSQNFRARSELDYGVDYLPFLNKVWDECWTLLRPGGILCVNVGSVLDEGLHYPLPQDISNQITNNRKKKWVYQRTFVWHKVTGGVKRAGSVIAKPFPGYWYPNIMTEHIMIFSKGASLKVCNNNNELPKSWDQPVWDIAPVPSRLIEHPAPFPEEIPHRLIRMYSPQGGLVLDPFNGSGSTTKAAFDLGRHSIGLDIQTTYLELARNRIGTATLIREMQLELGVLPRSMFVPGPSQGRTRHGSGKGKN